MPEVYTIGEFAEKYRFNDRREVLRYIALGVIKPMRRGGNSVFTENDAMKIVKYNTKKRGDLDCAKETTSIRAGCLGLTG